MWKKEKVSNSKLLKNYQMIEGWFKVQASKKCNVLNKRILPNALEGERVGSGQQKIRKSEWRQTEENGKLDKVT